MAVSVVTQPTDWNSCYVPLRYTFSSTLNPVLNTFTASIGSFLYPSTSQLSQYPNLISDKIIVRSTINVQRGDYVDITDTGEFAYLNDYTGRFLVLGKYGTDIVQIDAGFTTNLVSNMPPLYNPYQYIKVAKVYFNHVIKAALYLTNGNATFANPTPSTQRPIYTYELKVNKTTANAWAEVQEQLASYMREYLPSLNQSVNICNDVSDYILVNYFIRVWEEWDSYNTNLELQRNYSQSVAIPARHAIDAIVPHVEERNFDIISTATNLNDFKVFNQSDTNKRWLTNMPKSVEIGDSENYYLFFTGYVRLRIREYSSSGSLLATQNITPSISSGSTTVTNATQFNVGTANVSLNGNTAYYLVNGFIGPTNAPFHVTETIRFNIKQNSCLNNSSVRLYWKNLRGGVDAFTFNGKIDNVTMNADGYTHTGFKDIVRKTKQRDVVAQTSTYGKTFDLNSGFVTPDVADWLSEIAIRKSVYIELEGNYYPINILGSVNLPNSNNRTFNVTLKCEFAWRDKVQKNNYERLNYVYNNGVIIEPQPIDQSGIPSTRG
jgi:hypothetical protein